MTLALLLGSRFPSVFDLGYPLSLAKHKFTATPL